MNQMTFYWHDYEAGGVNPHIDRPMQFAGLRTHLNFNPIGKPLNIFCQLAPDYLPNPEACLITGITPQQCQRDGYIEKEFAAKIEAEFAKPNTIIVGYNNISYDDEMTRHLFYRNFIDPYAHTWTNNNSRWDLIHLVRACYALRPEGIHWPEHEPGRVNLKLEDLSQANQLAHENAHDALSDIYATIGLAKLIQEKQPKLFQWAFENRTKQAVLSLLNTSLREQTPLVHSSVYYGAWQGFCSWILPLGPLPNQANTYLAWRLDIDPRHWHENKEPEGTPRGLIKIRINQCPFLSPFKTLSQERADIFGLSADEALMRAKYLIEQPELRGQMLDYETEQAAHFIQNTPETPVDVDRALYQGPFYNDYTKNQMQRIRAANPEQLAVFSEQFEDPRFKELLFRYRARNFPFTLNEKEIEHWKVHCEDRLMHGGDGFLSHAQYIQLIEAAMQVHADNPAKQAILRDLYFWVQA